MSKQRKHWLTWLPRLLTIAFILFLALFALDVFGAYSTIWETLLALFMHLIPNVVLLIALLIAWRWKIIGGGVFLILGLMSMFVFDTTEHIYTFLFVSLPVCVIGILFIIDGLFEQREQTERASSLH